MTFAFPLNGTSSCYNDTDCGSDGRCSVILSDKSRACHCKTLYDPLDRCESFYYDRVSVLVYVIHILLVLVAQWRILKNIRKIMVREVRTVARKGCSAPTPMQSTIVAIILMALNDVAVATLYLAGSRAAVFLEIIGPTLFCAAFIVLVYFWFLLVIMSKNLGIMEKKWTILSRVIAACGAVGLTQSLVVGLLNSDDSTYTRPTSALVTVGLAMGVLVPIAIALPMCIYCLTWINREKNNVRLILWRCTWIVIVAMAWLVLVFGVLLVINALLPGQLFDVITVRRFASTFLGIGEQIIFVAFVRNTRRKKQATRTNPEIFQTTATPGSSSKSSAGAASTNMATTITTASPVSSSDIGLPMSDSSSTIETTHMKATDGS